VKTIRPFGPAAFATACASIELDPSAAIVVMTAIINHRFMALPLPHLDACDSYSRMGRPEVDIDLSLRMSVSPASS
jgi:hypothetical protein